MVSRKTVQQRIARKKPLLNMTMQNSSSALYPIRFNMEIPCQKGLCGGNCSLEFVCRNSLPPK